MQRRYFIQGTTAILATIGIASLTTNSGRAKNESEQKNVAAIKPMPIAMPEEPRIEWLKGFTVPEEELVGMVKPTMYGEGFDLREEPANAFDAMRDAAKKEGFDLFSVSSYRSFEKQKGIWNEKYENYRKNGKPGKEAVQAIIEYSTIPGSSRHHWGTDLDMIDKAKPEPEDSLMAKNFDEGGIYADLYEWLKKNAASFGFYMPYTNEPARKGFAYEPWHWSYAKLSIPLLIQYKNVDLKKYVDKANLCGNFYLTEEFLKNYKQVWGFGVNPLLVADECCASARKDAGR